MPQEKYILFDPNQYKEFGLKFYEGDNFYFRYQYREKLLWQSFYIPYGPNCIDENGFDEFLKFIKTQKFARIRIDLPLILDTDLKNNIKQKLIDSNFKSVPYIQDEETILIKPENSSFENKEIRYYVRKGQVNYDFEVLKNLDHKQINSVYKIYTESSERIGYKPKQIEVFHKLNQNSLVGVAINKLTGQIDAFVWGYKYNLFTNFKENQSKSILEIVFIGTNEESRKSFAGYGMHQILFKAAFESEKVDIINFRGASRSHDRKYLAFKKSFGGEFVAFAGSFEKINLV